MKAILFRNISEDEEKLFRQVMDITGSSVATTAIKEALTRWTEDRKKLDKAWADNQKLREENRQLEKKLENQRERTDTLRQSLKFFLSDD